MREALLDHLCCPACKGPLHLLPGATGAGRWIESGALACAACDERHPIEQGVPVFIPDHDRPDVVRTTSGFARNWNEFNGVILDNHALNDELFRDWILPVDPEELRGKLVLEPGCGMGRWLQVAQRYGPRALIGVDYSAIAYTAARNLREHPEVHVLRADILRLPLRPEMELTYCLGVVHHTPDPERTFGALVDLLAEQGKMTVWVYGAEHNAWIRSLVTPLREKVTSRLPYGVLFALSTPLALALRGAAAAWGAGLEKVLPYGEYMAHLRRYPFKYMRHIVFDHLVPEIAHYHSREELEGWARARGLEFQLSARNGNSWRLLVSRRARAPGGVGGGPAR